MDDRFKNAMDAVEPDESMIERLIKSEVYLFRRALTLICWGLALASFHINIAGLELALYSTWAGNILMILGLWMLRTENRRMTVALRCGVLMLITQTAAYWLGAFPSIDGTVPFLLSICVSVLSYTLLVIKIYCLFSGLRDLALRFENEALAKRLMRCFWLYVSLYLLIFACLFIPFLVYLLIPYVLFVLIKLPVTVGKLKQHVPLGRRATTVKAPGKWVWLTLCLYFAATIGGEFGALYYVNAPKPDALVYANTSSVETSEIREKLKELGMPEYVLNDLPDDEVRLYDGIYVAAIGIMTSTEITGRDGGKLEIVGFEGMMPEGKIRTLFYYRWLELPRHCYVDLLSIASTQDTFAQFENRNEKGLSLYDKDGKTYCQTLINEGAVIGFSHAGSYSPDNPSSGGLITQIQFRLYPNYENQRGYVALSRVVVHPTVPVNYNSFATYVHQQSLWNRPHFNALNQTAGQGYSHIHNQSQNTNAFWSEGFYTMTNYEPEGWVWTEENKDWAWEQVP